MKKVKTIVCTVIITMSIITMIAIPRKEVKVEAASGNSITLDNYKKWEVSTLTEGIVVLSEFFDKQSSLPVSPWTDGSLSALSKVYGSALKVDSNDSEVGKDLLREQLIQTVHGLEIDPIGNEFSEDQFSINNYPNDKLEYNLQINVNKKIKTPKRFDVMFVLDWSSSMDPNVGTIPNARSHARTAVEDVANRLLEFHPDSRVRLFGVNSQYDNNENVPSIQVDTGFISVQDDYQSIIKNAYRNAPDKQHDNIPSSVGQVKVKAEQSVRDGAIPIIFLLSDNQLMVTNDVRNRFSDVLDSYYNDTILINKANGVRPIFMEAVYETFKGYSHPMIDEVITPRKADGWDGMFIPKDNPIDPGQIAQNISDMVEGGMSSWMWLTQYDSNFTYKPGSFSPIDRVISKPPYSINSNGFYIKGSGPLEIKYDIVGSGTFPGLKKGDMIPANTTSFIVDASNADAKVSPNPNLFAPISDAAINLNVYKGSGSKDDPKNYQTTETIVSTDYNSFSGKSYTQKDARLAKLKYGTNIDLGSVKNILLDKLGTSAFINLNFASNNLNVSSKTISFDSNKNVYNLYAETKKAAEVSIYYLDESRNKIADTGAVTGLLGEKYEVKPKTIAGFSLIKTEGKTTGELSETPQTVNFIYTPDKNFDLVQSVTNSKNDSVTEIGRNGELNYSLAINSSRKELSPNSTYKNLVVTSILPKELEGISEMELVDSSNTSVGNVTYDSNTHELKGELIKTDLSQKESLRLTFKANVGINTPIGSTIKIDSNVDAAYSNGYDPLPKKSNTVSTKIVNEDSVLTVEFINEGNQVLPGYTIQIKGNYVGDTIDLVNNKEIIAQKENLTKAGYQIVSSPSNELNVLLDQASVSVQYKVKGDLVLSSAPDSLDFGSVTYDATTKQIEKPAFKNPLVVTDTRGDAKSGWTLTATLSKSLKNENGKELVDSLRYVSGGIERILGTNAVEAETNTTGMQGVFNLSDKWGSTKGSDGIKLHIDGNDTIYTGNYEGQITWKIMPGNP